MNLLRGDFRTRRAHAIEEAHTIEIATALENLDRAAVRELLEMPVRSTEAAARLDQVCDEAAYVRLIAAGAVLGAWVVTVGAITFVLGGER